MSNFPATPHINVQNEIGFGKTVLMPGDPLRSKFIAENFLENPSQYYVYEKADKDSDCLYDGIYPFCTPGCYSDFCLVVTGEMRGKILYTDNMGAYELIANSFEEFYQNWLNCISDTENLHKEIGERRIFGKKTIFGYLHKFRFIPHRKPSDNP